jgi:hypothetical protein
MYGSTTNCLRKDINKNIQKKVKIKTYNVSLNYFFNLAVSKDREIPITEAANKKSLTPVVTPRPKLRSEVILVELGEEM